MNLFIKSSYKSDISLKKKRFKFYLNIFFNILTIISCFYILVFNIKFEKLIFLLY